MRFPPSRYEKRAWLLGLFTLCLVAIPCELVAIDQDGDGMSDVWQQVYQISSGDTASDPDGDGYPNWKEAQFGTDPNSFDDGQGQPTLVGGTTYPVVEWFAIEGIPYQLRRSEDLVSWADIDSAITGTDANVTFNVTLHPYGSASMQFFRLKLLIPADGDGDLLNAYEESLLELSDSDNDFDDDGVQDGTEFMENSNPDDAASNSVDLIGLELFTPLED